MKSIRLVLLALSPLLAGPGFALADETPAPDTSKWDCKFCPGDAGQHGFVDLGGLYVDRDSFRYGEYSGLRNDGIYGGLGGLWRWRGDNANWARVDAADFGLESRSLDFAGGRQGAYKVAAFYDAVPQFRFDQSRSPFRNVGGEILTLPAGWTAAGTTGTMVDLAAGLHDADIYGRRLKSGLSFSATPAPEWDYSVAYRHEEKSGIGDIGGSFITQASILPYPLASDTDMVDAAAGRAASRWQVRIGYSGSMFTNHHDALTWQNPYAPAVPSATTGRLALAPDNQSHQVSVVAGYQPEWPVRLLGQVAAGRMTQDDAFVPATANATLATPLPRTSLDGEVDTLTALARVSGDPLAHLRLTAEYRFSDHDNRTPTDSYTQVVTDTFTGGTRTNLPYSFIQNETRVRADYRVNSLLRLAAGASEDVRKRDLQARTRTTDDSWWGRVTLRPLSALDVQLRAKRSIRDGDAFTTVTNITAPENPLERAFHLANRRRDEAGMDATLIASERTTLGAGATFARDRYSSGGALGLRDRRDLGLNGNASFMPLEQVWVSGFVYQDWYRTHQDGSQSFGSADWSGFERDSVTSYGLRAQRAALGSFDLGAEYVFTRSDAVISMDSGTGSGFPDLFSRLHEARLYAVYHLRPDLAVRLDARRDSYAVRDWALDDVAPDTIPNVLALGQGSQPYLVTFFGLTARYAFGPAAKN